MTASSQVVTKSTTTTDSIIPLPKNVAKAVVKDIIRKDSLETELSVAYKNIDLMKSNLAAQDSIIKSKDNAIELWKLKETNYLTIIDLKEQQKTNLEALTKSLNQDLKKAKRKQRATTVVGVAAVGVLTYLLLK